MKPPRRRGSPALQSLAISASAHLHIVAGVEGLQVELARGLGGPQAQVDGVAGVEAGDGVVVRHRHHLLAGVPLEHLRVAMQSTDENMMGHYGWRTAPKGGKRARQSASQRHSVT